ncbi:MAG: glucose 1-dehydrogenase [Thermoleophilia bacterium]|nr:glucose 1-dehydrogenase [Thermoleophilia bacterium]
MNISSLFDLTDKVAVVTGATRGIGKGLATALAAAGARVVVVSRHGEDCERATQEIVAKGGQALPVAADVSQLEAVADMVSTVLAAWGKIDILVNNAGTAVTKRAEDLTVEEWHQVLDTNLTGVFLCCQTVGRHMIMRRTGKIINVGSVLAFVAERQVLPYCASKGGVLQLTRALALEWARYNVQVNALFPGYIETDLNREQLADEYIRDRILRKIPMRRLGTVDDLVGAIIFLSSPASDYMTGQVLVIDGGWLAE